MSRSADDTPPPSSETSRPIGRDRARSISGTLRQKRKRPRPQTRPQAPSSNHRQYVPHDERRDGGRRHECDDGDERTPREAAQTADTVPARAAAPELGSEADDQARQDDGEGWNRGRPRDDRRGDPPRQETGTSEQTCEKRCSPGHVATLWPYDAAKDAADARDPSVQDQQE